MVDYTRLQSIADRLIANADDSEVKQSVYTPAIDGGGYDNNGNPLPSQPRFDIFGSASPLFSYKQDEIDGDVVRATDAYIFFSPDDKAEEVEIGMFYDVNGKTYRVQHEEGITSNRGVKVYQKLQLRS